MSLKRLQWIPAACLASGLTTLLVPQLANADVPRIAADIAPIHSLVARVMDGVGTPELIVSPGASPHEYSLRPSQASALQAADLVFWVSPSLTPWMSGMTSMTTTDMTRTLGYRLITESFG